MERPYNDLMNAIEAMAPGYVVLSPIVENADLAVRPQVVGIVEEDLADLAVIQPIIHADTESFSGPSLLVAHAKFIHTVVIELNADYTANDIHVPGSASDEHVLQYRHDLENGTGDILTDFFADHPATYVETDPLYLDILRASRLSPGPVSFVERIVNPEGSGFIDDETALDAAGYTAVPSEHDDHVTITIPPHIPDETVGQYFKHGRPSHPMDPLLAGDSQTQTTVETDPVSARQLTDQFKRLTGSVDRPEATNIQSNKSNAPFNLVDGEIMTDPSPELLAQLEQQSVIQVDLPDATEQQ